jgi:SAM-dependent methyltransferase
MQAPYRVRQDCRLCRSKDLDKVVPLAPMPIATPNFRLHGVSREDAIYREAVPLDLYLCRACGLLQVTHVADAHVQFDNYVYATSLSLGLRQHFQRYAEEVVAAVRPLPDALVVELGSNDGTLLGFFKSKGLRVQGCDPAASIAAKAAAGGIPTVPDFFGTAVARRIRNEQGPATIVVANNVIANVDDLFDLIAGVRDVLADDGVFVFETQYGLDVVVDNLLDTVYHEHLSYFYIRPLQMFLRNAGMEMIDVVHIPTKGGSIRVFAQKAGGPRPVAVAVGDAVKREMEIGAYDEAIYRRLVERIATVRDQLNDEVARARDHGRKVAGYGVSVGTTTLLSQFALSDKLDMLFDDDLDKEPVLSGPGYDLPVFGPAALLQHDPGLIVIFAWRYADSILAKHRAWLDAGGIAAVPLPDVRLVRR